MLHLKFILFLKLIYYFCFKNIYLFICLHWVLVAACRSLVSACKLLWDIFLDLGSNQGPLHWEHSVLPLDHQESAYIQFLLIVFQVFLLFNNYNNGGLNMYKSRQNNIRNKYPYLAPTTMNPRWILDFSLSHPLPILLWSKSKISYFIHKYFNMYP